MSFEKFQNKIESCEGGKNVTLWFVRHAESEGNVLGGECPVNHDMPLTESGVRQAHTIVEYLKSNNINITDIYTSPLGRANKTAQIIADELDLNVITKTGLKERNWGEWGGEKWEVISNKLDTKGIDDRYTFIPDGGESWQQMEQRLFEALVEIVDKNSNNENILVVLHQGNLRALLPVLDNKDKAEHKDFSVGTGTLTAYSLGDGIKSLGIKPE